MPPPNSESTPQLFPIVGIGASAGGLEALEKLISRLKSDGMAYVVLQHLAPGHESLLTEILARSSEIRVVTIQDGMRVEPNVLYVMPPDMEVSLEGGVLRAQKPPDRVPRHSIDAFLRSLAMERGTAAIGVILSGAGSDGTLGLRAIKEEGGITFAQSPATASQPSMPQSAIDSGNADFFLSPEEIGDELMRLSAHPFVARKRPVRLFDDESLGRLFENLRRAFGVDFSRYKLTTIERRIARRMALAKLERIRDYLTFLDSNVTELNVLYSDLLIGVTTFFRDKEPFEALRTVVFPRLMEGRSTERPVRIWVPGCATGEEAYSIAISLLEFLGERAAGIRVQIFATDIDEEALARARMGLYPLSIELDVTPDRLQRFFSRLEKGYQVSRQLRDMVVFARHDLGKDPPFSRLDLVSCRNVLIYMQLPLQKKVLRVFHYALNPDAFLLLGLSESVGEASDLFTLVDRSLKVYAKKNVASAAVFDFALGARVSEEPRSLGIAALPAEHRPVVSVQQLADRKVIEKYGPPGVLLNENLEIIQFRGRTGAYLEPTPGTATFSIFKLARPEFLAELRAALQEASTTDLPVQSPPIRLLDDGATSVTLDVVPLHDPATKRKWLLVSFQSLERPPVSEVHRAKAPASEEADRVEELQRELLTTKEYLQSTIGELETANEEMQSSNEELQSSNEELQSTNEELETSKEELQSTNEELATVNEELSNRMTQLAVSNDDLQNVLAHIDEPVVIVGMDLRIRRFSAAAEKLLSLVPGDLGRPIAYLGNSVKAPQIEQTVAETINSVVVKEQRVHCTDGNWYTMRVTPYRTADHAIRGAVIDFARTPASRKAGELMEVNELVGKILSTLPNALVLLDPQMRVLWANRKFFETFQVGAEVLGAAFDQAWAARSDYPELFALLDATISGGPLFKDFVVSRPFGAANGHPLRFSAQCVPPEGDRPALTLLVIEGSSEAAK